MNRAAWLWGAAIAADTVNPYQAEQRINQEPTAVTARTILGADDFEQALARGRGLAPEEAISAALGAEASPPALY
jgi:hypothetical protein